MEEKTRKAVGHYEIERPLLEGESKVIRLSIYYPLSLLKHHSTHSQKHTPPLHIHFQVSHIQSVNAKRINRIVDIKYTGRELCLID